MRLKKQYFTLMPALVMVGCTSQQAMQKKPVRQGGVEITQTQTVQVKPTPAPVIKPQPAPKPSYSSFSDWKSDFLWEDGDTAKKPVDEMFGGSSSGGRADRGDGVGRRERVKRAQEAKAKRAAVKDTPIDKYKPSPAMARYLAKTRKEEFVFEDDMKGMSVKSGHKRPTKSGAGMTQKGVEAYRRRNPGSKLKTAVTTEPSKLKKGSKAANRRKSYCARSAGQMKKFPKAAKDPDSRLRQARRRWNC